jgi:hypothetical protein
MERKTTRRLHATTASAAIHASSNRIAMRPSVNSRLIPVISDVHNFPIPPHHSAYIHRSIAYSLLLVLFILFHSFFPFLFSHLSPCGYTSFSKKLVSHSIFLLVSLFAFRFPIFQVSSSPHPPSFPLVPKLSNSQDGHNRAAAAGPNWTPLPALGMETDSLLRLQQGPSSSIESR